MKVMEVEGASSSGFISAFSSAQEVGWRTYKLESKAREEANTEETNLTHKGVEIAFSKACAPARRALTSVWRQFILRRDSRCASDGKHKQDSSVEELIEKKYC